MKLGPGPQGGKASTAVKNRYNKEAYDRLYPYVKKGYKEIFETAQKKGNYSSLNDFIEQTLLKKSMEILGEKVVNKMLEEKKRI